MYMGIHSRTTEENWKELKCSQKWGNNLIKNWLQSPASTDYGKANLKNVREAALGCSSEVCPALHRHSTQTLAENSCHTRAPCALLSPRSRAGHGGTWLNCSVWEAKAESSGPAWGTSKKKKKDKRSISSNAILGQRKQTFLLKTEFSAKRLWVTGQLECSSWSPWICKGRLWLKTESKKLDKQRWAWKERTLGDHSVSHKGKRGEPKSSANTWEKELDVL